MGWVIDTFNAELGVMIAAILFMAIGGKLFGKPRALMSHQDAARIVDEVEHDGLW